MEGSNTRTKRRPDTLPQLPGAAFNQPGLAMNPTLADNIQNRSGTDCSGPSACEKGGSAMPPDDEPPGALQIQVANQQTAHPVDRGALKQAVKHVVGASGILAADVSVAVVDDQAMHELNRQFLQHDYPTDVLSFSLSDTADPLEGEIVVSADTAARQAAAYGWQAADELLLYVVHGALHLIGHSDKGAEESAAMRAREAEVIDALGIRRSPTDPRWKGLTATNPGRTEGDPAT